MFKAKYYQKLKIVLRVNRSFGDDEYYTNKRSFVSFVLQDYKTKGNNFANKKKIVLY